MNTSWKVASVLALLATQPVWGCGGDYGEYDPIWLCREMASTMKCSRFPSCHRTTTWAPIWRSLYPTTAQPGDASSPEPMDEVDLDQLTEQALPPMSELAGALGVNRRRSEEAGKRAVAGWRDAAA